MAPLSILIRAPPCRARSSFQICSFVHSLWARASPARALARLRDLALGATRPRGDARGGRARAADVHRRARRRAELRRRRALDGADLRARPARDREQARLRQLQPLVAAVGGFVGSLAASAGRRTSGRRLRAAAGRTWANRIFFHTVWFPISKS